LSKSKFRLTKGVALIQTTGEPLFVTGFTTKQNLYGESVEYANVIRPVATTNGIEYREDTFPCEQLETRHAQLKRNVELEEFVNTLREEANARRYSLSQALRQSLEKMNPPQANNPLVAPKQLSIEGI
jgi:hypothetical protein